MSIRYPTNDQSRLSIMERVLDTARSETLSTFGFTIPESEIAALEAAYQDLVADTKRERDRNQDLETSRAVVALRMPILRRQIRGLWSAVRSYAKNVTTEAALLGNSAEVVNSDTASDVDKPLDKVQKPIDPASIALAVVRWYDLPDQVPASMSHGQWVQAGQHLIKALDGAEAVGLPTFQTTSAERLSTLLDDTLLKAIDELARVRIEKRARTERSQAIRKACQTTLGDVAGTVRYRCRGKGYLAIRETLRAFGFVFEQRSAGDAPESQDDATTSTQASSPTPEGTSTTDSVFDPEASIG